MTKYVALLRGINVAGKHKILMKDLTAILVKTGLTNVTTYIQSGNVIFQSNLDSTELSQLITTSIKNTYAYITVIVHPLAKLKVIIENNPFVPDCID